MNRVFLTNSVVCTWCFCYWFLKIHSLLFWKMVVKMTLFSITFPTEVFIKYCALQLLHSNSETK